MEDSKKSIKLIVGSFNKNQIAALARVSLELGKILQKKYKVEIISFELNKKVKECFVFEEVEEVRVKKYIVNTLNNFYEKVNQDYFLNDNESKNIYIFFQNIFGLLKLGKFINNKKGLKTLLFLFTPKVCFFEIFTFKFLDFFKSTKRLLIHLVFTAFFVPNFLIQRAVKKIKFSHVFFQSKFALTKMEKIFNKLPDLSLKCFRLPALFEMSEKLIFSKDLDHRKKFNLKEDDFVILHSGLGSFLRGVDDVVKFFSYLKDNYNLTNLKLFIAIFARGGGTSSREIDKLKISLKKKYLEDVVFIDYPYKKISEIYQCADLAIFPYRLYSDIPDCPLTVVELQKYGVPVFVNDIGQVKEYVANEKFILNKNFKKNIKFILKVINESKYNKELNKDILEFNKVNKINLQKNITDFLKLILKL